MNSVAWLEGRAEVARTLGSYTEARGLLAVRDRVVKLEQQVLTQRAALSELNAAHRDLMREHEVERELHDSLFRALAEENLDD